MIKIIDKSKEGVYSSNMELVDNFLDYSSSNLDFDKPVDVELIDDEQNAKNPLGATAYYNPDEMKIVVYVTDRHLKDILRSISHELIHHVQNCRGDLGGSTEHTDGYAQKDDHLRNMEHEAYTKGNIMNFRDFEDTYKKGNKQMKTTLQKLKKIINEEVSAALNEEVVQVALKFSGKANHQKAADKKCREKGFDGGRMTRAYRAPSPEGSGDYKCMRCPEGSAPGKATPNSLNPMGCGFADGTEPSEEELTRGVRFALGAIGLDLDDKATATGKGPGKRRIKYRTCRKLPLRLGCKGDMVMVLQSLLHNALKLKTSKKKFIDSQYGPGTKKAVKVFQRKAKIAVDGVAGEDTFDALRKTQPKKAVAGLDKRVDDATASVAGPTGIDRILMQKIGSITMSQLNRSNSQSEAMRNLKPDDRITIRNKYWKQIVSNVARQFKEGKLTKDTEIQAAVQKLVFDAGPKMDAEAK
ncbi:MAG TPA: hypothetical protein DG048_06970 [Pseudoalteromonas sp.]|nr:hypothetical protein [Pseudoalteromonas sp.]